MSGKTLSISVIACSIVILAVLINLEYRNILSASMIHEEKRNIEKNNETNWLKDWHDYAATEAALNTSGLGEVGRPANIEDYRLELYKEYGYDAMLSDYISVNRTVPDTRHEDCKNKTYLAKLPKAAVIIIFHNERLSVLLRTVHGIINRTPDELLQEIILVDDSSTYSELHAPLTYYLHYYLPTERSKVRLIRMPKRAGLMVARMTGARAASKESEVLIFMDAHFEVNYNWLPPLLEPIALNPKTCTCPGLDAISFKDFEYKVYSPFRGYFDWTLGYKFLALKSHEYETPARNWHDYVLMGASIAIGADFFWDLGGFDEGMVLWGGEQFELSFKVWMCGGEIIHVPCSRMAHLYRDPSTKGNTNLYRNYDFVERNIRRLIDVWMDEEHRQYVFHRRPAVKNADPGNLTERIAIRERLKCQSFSWLMENVMPDLKYRYPPYEPYDLGSGLIRSVYNSSLCVTLTDSGEVILESCPVDGMVNGVQNWIYNWFGEIRTDNSICLVTDLGNKRVSSYYCHGTGGNQKWYYDVEKQSIAREEYNLCIVASIEDRTVKLSECNENDLSMKWTFTHVNITEMGLWENQLRWRK